MFAEVIATIHTADPGTARFIARRLMEVWAYYLPMLGMGPDDFDLTTTVTDLNLEPEDLEPGLAAILGGALELSASDTDQPGRRTRSEGVDPDRDVGQQYA